MQLRDAMLVMLAIIFSIFFWAQEGAISFQSGFVAPFDSLESSVSQPGPKPLVIALSDGSETLVVARGKRLALYFTADIQANTENIFIPLQPTLEREFSAKIVGIGAGHIRPPAPLQSDGDPLNPPDSHEIRDLEESMMIAVVDESYALTLIRLPSTWQEMQRAGAATDGDAADLFQPLWAREIAPVEARAEQPLTHAAVSVMWERVFDDDSGMVIVAVAARDSDNSPARLFAAFHGGDGKDRWRYLSDLGGEMDDVLHEVHQEEADREKLLSNASSPVPQKKGAADLSPRDFLSAPKFAFDDATRPPGVMGVGSAGGVHFQRSSHATRPSRMYEKPWTTYRESIISALPHYYRHPWDEQLHPHVLYQSRNRGNVRRGAAEGAGRGLGRKQQPNATADAAKPSRRGVTLLAQSKIFRTEANDYGELGDVMAQRLEEVRSRLQLPMAHHGEGHVRGMRRARHAHRLEHPPNGLVLHSKEGMEVVHLYSGYSLTSVIPLTVDTYYDDINDDFQIESIANRIGVETKSFGRFGVSTDMECEGVIRTGLPAARHLLLNSTICDTPGIFANSNFLQRFMRGDTAAASSSPAVDKLELLGSYNSVSQSTSAAPPLVVQLQYSRAPGVVALERRALFLLDSGLVTSLDPSRRRVAWRTAARTSFSPGAESHYPHLSPYAISQPQRDDDPEFVGGGVQRFDRAEPYVIAVGDRAMATLHTSSGAVVQHVTLPHPPVGPLLVADFNGDGVNDVLVVTAHGVYGFVGVVQLGASSVAGLLSAMLAVLLLLFLTRDLSLLEVLQASYSSAEAVPEDDHGLDGPGEGADWSDSEDELPWKAAVETQQLSEEVSIPSTDSLLGLLLCINTGHFPLPLLLSLSPPRFHRTVDIVRVSLNRFIIVSPFEYRNIGNNNKKYIHINDRCSYRFGPRPLIQFISSALRFNFARTSHPLRRLNTPSPRGRTNIFLFPVFVTPRCNVALARERERERAFICAQPPPIAMNSKSSSSTSSTGSSAQQPHDEPSVVAQPPGALAAYFQDNGSPFVVTFENLFEEVQRTFEYFDGTDNCLKRRCTGVTTALTVDRASPADPAPLGLVTDEEQRWFTVAHLLARSIFHPPFFRKPAEMGILDLRTWRRLYANTLCMVLPELGLGKVTRLDVLFEWTGRAMLEWVSAPFGEELAGANRTFAALYPEVYARAAEVEAGATLSPEILSAVLLVDTVRWVSTWYPMMQGITQGFKVLWRVVSPVPLFRRLKVPPAADPEEDLYADGPRTPVPDEELLRFLYDLHGMLEFEVRAQDAKGRPRGVAVPTSWMTELLQWISTCRATAVVRRTSPFSPFMDSGNEDETTVVPVPPGPIRTLDAVELMLACAASPNSPVRHRIRADDIASVVPESQDDEQEMGGADSALAPVEVLPAVVFDFLAATFGAGPKVTAYGAFQTREQLAELVRPPMINVEVHFERKPSSEASTLKVGRKEIEIVSDTKIVCISITALPCTSIADVIRSCFAQAKEEGELTADEEAIWLGATGGDYDARSRQGMTGEVVVSVAFLEVQQFAPPLQACRTASDVAKSSGRAPLPAVDPMFDTVGSVLLNIKNYCQKHKLPYPLEDGARMVDLTLRANFRRCAVPEPSTSAEEAEEGSTRVPRLAMVPLVPRHPGLSGLTNVGNTCFMNGALQCLAHLDSFREQLVNQMLSNKRFTGVGVALQELFVSMWCGTQTVVDTFSFKQQMELRRSRYIGYHQQDATEFIDELLDCVCEELNTCVAPRYRERQDTDYRIPAPELSQLYWDDFLANRSSFIPALFFHQSKSRFECATCHRCSVVFEQDSSLSVPIKEVPVPVTAKVHVLLDLTACHPIPPQANDAAEPMSYKQSFMRFEASMRIPGLVGRATGNPPLPPSRVEQVMRMVERNKLLADTVATLREFGAAELDEEMQTGGTPPAFEFHVEYVCGWDHEGFPNEYFLYARCAEGASTRLPPLAADGVTLPPSPPRSPTLPPPSAPVYYCFAPRSSSTNLISATSPVVVDAELVFMEDLADTVAASRQRRPGEDEGDAAPLSRAILKRARELGETLLSGDVAPYYTAPLSEPEAKEELLMCDVSNAPLAPAVPATLEDEETGDPYAPAKPPRKKVSLKVVALDLSPGATAAAAAAPPPPPPTHAWDSSKFQSGLTKDRFLEVTREQRLNGDGWAHKYYDAMAAAGHTGAQAPLVVLILYKEEECIPAEEEVGYTALGFLVGDKTELLQFDTTLEASLQMALQAPNTLSGDDSWYCPSCKAFVTAETRRTLFRLPPCLILSFRRFKQHGDRAVKNSAHINFPDRLDLKPYLDEEADLLQPSTYQLKGVLYHSGTLDFGHYTASALVTPQRTWANFNDSHAHLLDSSSVSRTNAYVLCFEREDMLVKRSATERTPYEHRGPELGKSAGRLQGNHTVSEILFPPSPPPHPTPSQKDPRRRRSPPPTRGGEGSPVTTILRGPLNALPHPLSPIITPINHQKGNSSEQQQQQQQHTSSRRMTRRSNSLEKAS
eukprot:gene2101-1279_t